MGLIASAICRCCWEKHVFVNTYNLLYIDKDITTTFTANCNQGFWGFFFKHLSSWHDLNTLRSEQNGVQFADEILKCISWRRIFKFVFKFYCCWINIQMTTRDKPLPGLRLMTSFGVTRFDDLTRCGQLIIFGDIDHHIGSVDGSVLKSHVCTWTNDDLPYTRQMWNIM